MGWERELHRGKIWAQGAFFIKKRVSELVVSVTLCFKSSGEKDCVLMISNDSQRVTTVQKISMIQFSFPEKIWCLVKVCRVYEQTLLSWHEGKKIGLPLCSFKESQARFFAYLTGYPPKTDRIRPKHTKASPKMHSTRIEQKNFSKLYIVCKSSQFLLLIFKSITHYSSFYLFKTIIIRVFSKIIMWIKANQDISI